VPGPAHEVRDVQAVPWSLTPARGHSVPLLASAGSMGMGEEQLSSDVMKDNISLDLDFIETQLKVSCGNAKSIEGICSWPRLESIKSKFDKRSFTNVHPDIADSYIFTPAPTYSFIVNEFHPYPLTANALKIGG
jgi:hypothetical protein